VVATGTPEEVAADGRSYTGQVLQGVLAKHGASRQTPETA
jgi:excinuclease UvrABC ATPase subunit